MTWRLSTHLVFSAIISSLLIGPSSAPTHPRDWTTWQSVSGNQDIFVVAIHSQPPEGVKQYFTSESLEEALPRLWPAHILANWCKSEWKQRGVIVLKNKEVIFWHSCAMDLIVFEGDRVESYGFRDKEAS